jgi:hypothetical protein
MSPVHRFAAFARTHWITATALAVAVAVSMIYARTATPALDAVLYELGTIAAAVAAAAAWGFCALYSRGPWRMREAGRHMMYATGVKGVIFTYVGVVSMFYGEPQNPSVTVIRFWIMFSCAVILVWRFRMLWHDVQDHHVIPRLRDPQMTAEDRP